MAHKAKTGLRSLAMLLALAPALLSAACGGVTPLQEAKMLQTYELHFQEGFTGETVEIDVDGETVASFEAKTRMQLGLAHIERLELAPGQEITIRIDSLDLAETVGVEDELTTITINLVEDELIVESTDMLPGYL